MDVAYCVGPGVTPLAAGGGKRVVSALVGNHTSPFLPIHPDSGSSEYTSAEESTEDDKGATTNSASDPPDSVTSGADGIFLPLQLY